MAIKSNTKEFIKKSVAVHGDKFDYSNVKYENNRKKVEIICKKHGVFQLAPNKHLIGRGCPVCGIERRTQSNITHGNSNSKEYIAWAAMKDRCYNQNHVSYHRYGGRGINVCDRWLNSFENFFADMGEKPEGCSVDRINNDKDYCPENCRWATSTEQANNKSNNISLTICNKTMSLKDWCQDTGQNYTTVYTRLKAGWTPEEAIFGRKK